MRVISADRHDFVEVFAGLGPMYFRRLVRAVERAGGRELVVGRPGRPWSLSLQDRVLLVAMYYRTNLTMRQLAPLFGISSAAVGRVIDRHSPWLALQSRRRRPKRNDVLIADGRSSQPVTGWWQPPRRTTVTRRISRW
jgi:hypothetical protein